MPGGDCVTFKGWPYCPSRNNGKHIFQCQSTGNNILLGGFTLEGKRDAGCRKQKFPSNLHQLKEEAPDTDGVEMGL